MLHNPLYKEKDLIITYSDIHDKTIDIYAEEPNSDGSDFNYMEMSYPSKQIVKITGFSKSDIKRIMYHINKLAPIAYAAELEDNER